MITKQEIRQAVCELRLSSRPVCLHSSFRSFGGVEGGPKTVVQAFLTEQCTIMVPSFSDDFGINPPPDIRPERNGWNYANISRERKGEGRIFSAETNEITQIEMGIIPATVLAQSDRIRGNHPLCSFASIGSEAGNLILPQTPIDVFAPLRTLAELGGWVILAGVGLCSMTLLHAAEELAGRRPFIRWANGADGKPTGVTMGGCSEGFNQFEPIILPLAKRCLVGKSLWNAFPAAEVLKIATAAIRSRGNVTRCSRLECERCDDQISGGPIGWEELANKGLYTGL